MPHDDLRRFLALARSTPALLAELRRATGPQGLPLDTLAEVAARHGHPIDLAGLGRPGPRLSAESPPNPSGLRVGEARIWQAADGRLMVQL